MRCRPASSRLADGRAATRRCRPRELPARQAAASGPPRPRGACTFRPLDRCRPEARAGGMDLGTGGLRVVASGDSGDTTSLRDTIGGLSPNDLRDVPRAPGARVGRYIVLERVGHGGMGVVYAAF